MQLRFTLLGDGTFDRALQPILLWLVGQHLPAWELQAQWADLRRLSPQPKGLGERIARAVELFPCDLLFVHRDAEREPREARTAEIRAALRAHALRATSQPAVCVIPVRMTEAWLLFDESAIRAVVGVPRGTTTLALPRLRDVEHIPDPKQLLHDALRRASGLRGRRLAAFDAPFHAHRVAEWIEDYALLRQLGAFRALEAELVATLTAQGWL
jgi:hypothetical protein